MLLSVRCRDWGGRGRNDSQLMKSGTVTVKITSVHQNMRGGGGKSICLINHQPFLRQMVFFLVPVVHDATFQNFISKVEVYTYNNS